VAAYRDGLNSIHQLPLLDDGEIGIKGGFRPKRKNDEINP
jgi:hypothetical protein